MRRGFSLFELVIAFVIIGVITAITLPRVTAIAESSTQRALESSLAQLQEAVEHFRAEHAGRCPATEPDGSTSTNPRLIAARLMRTTDSNGTLRPIGEFGPYLARWPTNPINGDLRIRLDGDPAGSDQAGWRYCSLRKIIENDASCPQITPAGATADLHAWAGAQLAAGGTIPKRTATAGNAGNVDATPGPDPN